MYDLLSKISPNVQPRENPNITRFWSVNILMFGPHCRELELLAKSKKLKLDSNLYERLMSREIQVHILIDVFLCWCRLRRCLSFFFAAEPLKWPASFLPILRAVYTLVGHIQSRQQRRLRFEFGHSISYFRFFFLRYCGVQNSPNVPLSGRLVHYR